MTKVKIFGVLRTTTSLSYLETESPTVMGVFEEISKVMEKKYYEDLQKQEELKKSDKPIIKKRNAALEPHKELKFGDAIVYINGERCLKKRKKLKDGDEMWIMSPAAGG